MENAQLACEICSERIDAMREQSYPRSGSGSPTVVAKGLKQCSTCGRRGCPRCLQVVEERVDDYFFDLYSCRDCLDGTPARPR